MRIFYPVNSEFPPNRANGIQVVKTARALAEAGAEVCLAMRRASDRPVASVLESMGSSPHPRLRIVPIRVIRDRGHGGRLAKLANFSFYPSCLKMMKQMAAQEEIDVIYTRLITRRIFGRMVKICDRYGPKLIFESHQLLCAELQGKELTPPVHPSALNPEARRAFREESLIYAEADGTVFISDSLADAANRLFAHRAKSITAHDATDLFADASPPRAPLNRIAYCGSFESVKGVDLLIGALENLPPSATLTLIGEGLANIRLPKALSPRIQRIGRVDPRDVPRRLAEADILALPTLDTIQSRYSSPLKLFEYMAARRPIVASDLPGIREVLGHERNALLFRPGDPDELADRIRRLRGDADLSLRLADQAHADAEQYTWENRGDRIVRFIEEIL